MELAEQYVKERFDKYNKELFDGKLPDIPFEITYAKGYLGRFAYRLVRGVKKNFVIRITNVYDMPSDLVDDVIVHEMIHYHIVYNNMLDDSPHGRLFHYFMDIANRDLGLHVHVSYRNAKLTRRVPAEQREDVTPRIVAVVKFADGKTGIKVLPRILQRILHYHDVLTHSPQIVSIKLYDTLDVFFHKYPRSAALKAYYVDPDVLEEHLKFALPLKCNGKKVWSERQF